MISCNVFVFSFVFVFIFVFYQREDCVHSDIDQLQCSQCIALVGPPPLLNCLSHGKATAIYIWTTYPTFATSFWSIQWPTCLSCKDLLDCSCSWTFATSFIPVNAKIIDFMMIRSRKCDFKLKVNFSFMLHTLSERYQSGGAQNPVNWPAIGTDMSINASPNIHFISSIIEFISSIIE